MNRLQHDGAYVPAGESPRAAPPLGNPGNVFVARESDGTYTLWVERVGVGHERLGAVPVFGPLDAMPGSQAGVGSNLATVHNATTDRVETVRFDVLMGALRRLQNEYVVTDPMFGVTGNGSTNDYTGLMLALTTASAAATSTGRPTTVIIPEGATCLTNSPLDLPANINLRVEGAIKAGAAMSYLLQTPLNTLAEDQRIRGDGFLLCNSLADVGIDLQYARHYVLSGVCVEDALVAMIRAGNSGAAGTSYEVIFDNVRTHRRSASVPAGAICVHIRAATDCEISKVTAIGGQTGFKIDTGGNRFSHCHAWTRQSTGAMLKAFHDTSNGNKYWGCDADTPSTYGWHFTGTNPVMQACRVYNNAEYGTDNTMIGLRFDNTNPGGTITDCEFKGADASHRILKDIEHAGSGTSTHTSGLITSNVTTTTNDLTPTSTTLGGGVFIGTTGNKISKHRNGSFTLSAANTTTVGNSDVAATSRITITPTNAAAATLMSGNKSLYISARTAGASFAVATADGTAAAGTETFDYVLIS